MSAQLLFISHLKNKERSTEVFLLSAFNFGLPTRRVTQDGGREGRRTEKPPSHAVWRSRLQLCGNRSKEARCRVIFASFGAPPPPPHRSGINRELSICLAG
ncbi:hypothetical protein CDAR_53061 [Caerostris darwini]|uniref:Uncharacterized protein n=1 Tax=Caerostris darwini TaxID=1538125 RepID=A0AAV4QPN3_9ARAC|nr:hypothetical protein CDAR_53061 [Caerostris darwini]